MGGAQQRIARLSLGVLASATIFAAPGETPTRKLDALDRLNGLIR